MEGIRELDDVLVVVGKAGSVPELGNGRKDGTVATTEDAQVGSDVQVGGIGVTAEDTAVALVPVVVLEDVAGDLAAPLANLVTSLGANEAPDVGTDVPTAEGVEIPVGLDGRKLGVVVVEGVVLGADELLGNGRAEEDTGDVVALEGVLAVSLPGDVDQGAAVVELGVLEERLDEAAGPVARDRDVGVVAVVVQVGGDEQPLGKAVVLEVLVEESQVLDLGQAVGVECNGVEANEEVVLASVVTLLLVVVLEALKAGVGETLVVVTPADALVLEEVDNGRDVLVNQEERIAVGAEVVTAGGGNVVRLRRSANTVHLSEQDTLVDQSLAVGVGDGIVVGGGLEIDLHDAVEDLALDVRSRRLGLGSSGGGSHIGAGSRGVLDVGRSVDGSGRDTGRDNRSRVSVTTVAVAISVAVAVAVTIAPAATVVVALAVAVVVVFAVAFAVVLVVPVMALAGVASRSSRGDARGGEKRKETNHLGFFGVALLSKSVVLKRMRMEYQRVRVLKREERVRDVDADEERKT